MIAALIGIVVGLVGALLGWLGLRKRDAKAEARGHERATTDARRRAAAVNRELAAGDAAAETQLAGEVAAAKAELERRLVKDPTEEDVRTLLEDAKK